MDAEYVFLAFFSIQSVLGVGLWPSQTNAETLDFWDVGRSTLPPLFKVESRLNVSCRVPQCLLQSYVSNHISFLCTKNLFRSQGPSTAEPAAEGSLRPIRKSSKEWWLGHFRLRPTHTEATKKPSNAEKSQDEGPYFRALSQNDLCVCVISQPSNLILV